MIDYVVRPGDTFYSIATAFGVTTDQLKSVNPEIADSNAIFVGQIIHIPEIYMRTIIEVNGYAFPDIDLHVLEDTLPYLTYLSLYSYQVMPDGSLAGIDDISIIQIAREALVAPLMVITNIVSNAGFSGALAHTILADRQVQYRLLDSIENFLSAHGYYGLNIDFEYIYPIDRLPYARFLRAVTERLRPLGYITIVTIPPKVSPWQLGTQYEAFDYSLIGFLADRVILSTYEWGYSFGPPLAVSPIEQVRSILNYAASVIPTQIILMGMPNYGYDWTLPYQASSIARTVSFNEAEALATRAGADIKFDPETQVSYFNYTDELGFAHVVWFDTEMGIRARLRFVDEYNLAGVSFWTINNFSPASYQTLNTMYDVRKVL
jgi:spore germination protein